MASTYMQYAEQVTDQVVSGIDQVKDITVTVVGEISRTVDGFLPDLPTVPFADRLPTAHETVEVSFASVSKVLDAVKGFWLAVVDVAAPEKVRKATTTKAKTKAAQA